MGSFWWFVNSVIVIFSITLIVFIVIDYRGHCKRVEEERVKNGKEIDRVVSEMSSISKKITAFTKNLTDAKAMRSRVTPHTGSYLEIMKRESDFKMKIAELEEQHGNLNSTLTQLIGKTI